ncbi:MAG: hypothetical protein COV35_00440 [Alphaproteobacteria bacterium CG11_big_fil_rev_8_21_14_0_20_39_49]|nr:MAG: hypothetical protein COV35_00440 [Alphaproteobacteria bacterium CG11_big_fil_rev_8_21_14_0_20_39_49]
MSAAKTLQTIYTELGVSDASVKIYYDDGNSNISAVNNAAQIAAITTNYLNAIKPLSTNPASNAAALTLLWELLLQAHHLRLLTMIMETM